MRLELHRELPTTEDFRRKWNMLVESMEQPEVFYTWEWTAAVLRSYQQLRPLIFAAYRGQDLAGVVALVENRDVTFLAAPTADYCDFVSSPNDRREFVELVVRELERQGFGSMKLSNMPANSASVQALRPRNAYAQFSRPAFTCAQILLESPDQRSGAIAVSRNSPKRTARLSRSGVIHIEHHTTWEAFSGEFPNFVNAHIARFVSQGRTSSLADPDRRHFVEELGRLLSEQGSLRCSVLSLGSKAVAWHFGMAFRGKWFWYQPAFDLGYDQASPGTYLLREVIREAASNPEFRAVDLGLGDESYKAQYANSAQLTLHFTLVLSRLRLAREMSRYYVAQSLKRSPKLERIARTTLSNFLAFREAHKKQRDGAPPLTYR